MSENNVPQPELQPEVPNSEAADVKAEIKKELKEEFKQEFNYHKKKKMCKVIKLAIVFLLGIGIGFFAGHREQNFHHGEFMKYGEQHVNSHQGNHMGQQVQHR